MLIVRSYDRQLDGYREVSSERRGKGRARSKLISVLSVASSSLVYFAVDKPLYRRGHATGLGFAVMAVIVSLLLHLDYKRDNARRDRLFGRPEDYEDGSDIDATTRSQTDPVLQKKLGLEGMTASEIERLGDRHPLFRYFV